MARVVKCGLIQAACTTPASEDLEKIRKDAIDKHLKLITEAARKGVQILCMQEIFATGASLAPKVMPRFPARFQSARSGGGEHGSTC